MIRSLLLLIPLFASCNVNPVVVRPDGTKIFAGVSLASKSDSESLTITDGDTTIKVVRKKKDETAAIDGLVKGAVAKHTARVVERSVTGATEIAKDAIK